jgi:hypothetical protein
MASKMPIFSSAANENGAENSAAIVITAIQSLAFILYS